MSGETIRDVIIRIAIEQKDAQLKMPDISPIAESLKTGGSVAAQATKQSVASAQEAVEQTMSDLLQFVDLTAEEEAVVRQELMTKAIEFANQQAAEEEKAYDKQAKEALDAYSRIMKSREKAAADAERQYDKEAKAAVDAYSRIMREREKAAKQAEFFDRKIESRTSAMTASYAMVVSSTMQAAKGIAFVVAANDEQAESFVRAIAKAQGYFDLVIGGTHVIKGLNDIQRHSVALLQLHTAATAANTAAKAANAATTGAQTGAQVAGNAALQVGTVGAGMFAVAMARVGQVIGTVAKAVFWPALVATAIYSAVKAYLYWADSAERANKRAEEAADRGTRRQIESLNRLATSQRDISQFRAGRLQSGDSQGIAAELAELQQQRAAFAEQAKAQPMRFDTREHAAESMKRLLSMQEQGVSLLQQELALHDQLKSSLQSEQAVAQNILRTAQEQLLTAENQNRSENARLGLMSRADQMRAKKLLEKVASGQELSIREAREALRLRILDNQVQAAGEKQSKTIGLTQAREAAGETRPLEQARRDVTAARASAGEAIEEITRELDAVSKDTKMMGDKIVKALHNTFATKEALESIMAGIEEVKHKMAEREFYDWRVYK